MQNALTHLFDKDDCCDASLAIAIVESLISQGIDREQLEALADGDAWIATWVGNDIDFKYKWGGMHLMMLSNDKREKVRSLSPCEEFNKIENVMTFNGSSSIPEPKERK